MAARLLLALLVALLALSPARAADGKLTRCTRWP